MKKIFFYNFFILFSLLLFTELISGYWFDKNNFDIASSQLADRLEVLANDNTRTQAEQDIACAFACWDFCNIHIATRYDIPMDKCDNATNNKNRS